MFKIDDDLGIHSKINYSNTILEVINYHDVHYTQFNSLLSYEGMLNINIFLEDVFFGNIFSNEPGKKT